MSNHREPFVSERLRERMRAARSVFVLTGAGVSAESGVPTFRGGGGAPLWKGMPFDVISSAGMAARDLPAVWEWFDYRRDLLQSLSPNPAHATLARWQDKFETFTLATQNVDGLHNAAGSREVFELHGNIWRARCLSCEERVDVRELESRERPPLCRLCGDSMRPDVVLFGELLPPGVYEQAASRAMGCDLCIVAGTSALVYPAADLPVLAKRAGAFLVEVNPERTPLSEFCDEALERKAGEVLPLLDF
ncbi:MAG: NAD-dependent deacylase [Acidobacteria bacterium]|nr:NAD-dependent deacylase [Acidobacteriota bacterium]